MDYFALTGGLAKAVYRIDIDPAIQNDLDQWFNLQAAQLLDPQLVVVPFERENFKPDETEVLQITPFDLPDLFFDPTQNPVGWPVLPTDDDVLARVYCVFAYDAALQRVIFQVVPKAQRLSVKWWRLVAMHGDTFTRLNHPGLVLGDSCHAVYEPNSLKFRSLHWAKQLIDITHYYRAATEADIAAFAALGSVEVEDLDTLQRTGQWHRTRMAYILDSGVLDNFSPEQLSAQAANFAVDISVVDVNGVKKLVIPKDLRKLREMLKFLEEEYYSGPITGVSYEANSKRAKD